MTKKLIILTLMLVLTTQVSVVEKLVKYQDITYKTEEMLRKEVLKELEIDPVHPEANLNSTKYFGYYNYPYEVHYITTEDGYILKFYRIQAKNSQIKSGLPPVYLQHGLLDNSDTWIINDEDKAPAFMLANQGYDVFMGNSRGNFQSRNHTTLNPDKDDQFWEFTYQNMSKYDLPAAFEYIHKLTNFDKIDYIGHSQGSQIMFISLSLHDPVVEKYLKHAILLGPVIYVENITSEIFKAMSHSLFYQIMKYFGIEEVLTYSWLSHPVLISTCRIYVCVQFLGPIADADPKLDNSERMDVMVGHEPGGTSLWNLHHWQQAINRGGWFAYDYGSDKLNQLHYGQVAPPQFDITQVTKQVYLMSGSSDRLADPLDFSHLMDHMVNAKKWHKEYEAGHLTFMWGKEMPHMADIFEILKNDIY